MNTMRSSVANWVTDAFSNASGPTGEKYRLGYRGDIEGLRAIAILLVIAAHAGISWLEGGFVGVDVFFVISGYLITGLLIQEIQATGKLRLLNFFARRLKRLLPGLLFMVLVVALIAAMLLSPIEQLDQTASAGVASVWLSNIYFGFANFDYFSAGADKSLFLHTWSLGVEEQFYLIWPLLILFLLGAWQWQGGQNNYSRLFFGMVGIFCICLLFSILLTYTKPLWAFYLMPSRAWQFALGALAFFWSEKGQGHVPGVASFSMSSRMSGLVRIGGWLGLTLIFCSAAILTPRVSYPGIWAVLPSVGAALILVSGANPMTASISRLLSVKPMQWTGRISYSWYLWHWPILLLGGVLLGGTGLLNQGLLVALSLGIAIFSYLVIETPIRNYKKLATRPKLTIATALMLMGVALTLTSQWSRAATFWAKSPELMKYQEARSDAPVLYSMGCDEWFYSARVRVCGFGSNDAEHTAVLIGDSIAGQWFPALATIYNKPGWRLLVITKSSCPMVDEPLFYPRIGREFTECADWRNAATTWIKELKPDVVFMGTTRTGFNKVQWTSGTARVLGRFASGTNRVFLISPTYELPFDGPGCLARQEWQNKFFVTDTNCNSWVVGQLENNIHTWLKQAANAFENVSVINMNSAICPNNRCSAVKEGKIIYRDNQHLTASYAESLGDTFLGEMQFSFDGLR